MPVYNIILPSSSLHLSLSSSSRSSSPPRSSSAADASPPCCCSRSTSIWTEADHSHQNGRQCELTMAHMAARTSAFFESNSGCVIKPLSNRDLSSVSFCSAVGPYGCPKGRGLAARTRRPRERRRRSVVDSTCSPCLMTVRNAWSALRLMPGGGSECASRCSRVPPRGRSRRRVVVPARPVQTAGCTCATQRTRRYDLLE